jgi:hypothetical protein
MNPPKRVFFLREERNRDTLLGLIKNLPLSEERPFQVTVEPFKGKNKSRDQEMKYHAMIGDISRHYEHCGKKWDAEDMKRLLVDQFKRDTINDPVTAQFWKAMGHLEMVPALDGSGVVMLGVQTRRFPVELASIFIEWLFAFGAELGIEWSQQ